MVIQFTIGAEARAALEPSASRIGFVRVDDTGALGVREEGASARPATVVKLSNLSFFDASRSANVFGQVSDPSQGILPVESTAFAPVEQLQPELSSVVEDRESTTQSVEQASLGRVSVTADTAPTQAKASEDSLNAGVEVGLPPALTNQTQDLRELELLQAAPPVAADLLEAAVEPVGYERNELDVGPAFGFDQPLLSPAAGTGLGPGILPPELVVAPGAPDAIFDRSSTLRPEPEGPPQVLTSEPLGNASLIGITPVEDFLEIAGLGQSFSAESVNREFLPSADKLDERPSFETFFRPPNLPPSTAEQISTDERKPVEGPEVELVNKFGTAAQTSIDEQDLSPDQLREVLRLQQRDQEVRAHEQAHISAAGGLATGPTFTTQQGPDGRSYAIGGEVQIDTSEAGTAKETIAKAQIIRRAALAPAEPSAQDMSVAASASQMEIQARAEVAANELERTQEMAAKSAEVAKDPGGVPTGIGSMGAADVAGIESRDQDGLRPDDGFVGQTIQGVQETESNKVPEKQSVARLAGGQGKAIAAYTLAQNAYQGRGDYIALA